MPSVCVPTTVPQRGVPFSPQGPGGPVPLLQRYYETLRLPSARLAALRCLRWAIPSFRPLFIPPAQDERLRFDLELVLPASSGRCDGDGRVSQVPGDPWCALALFFDPGGTEHARPSRRVGAAPAFDKTEGSRGQLSRLNRTAWALAVYASR